jgi:RNA polymerase sigma factor (sigma-70 family)
MNPAADLQQVFEQQRRFLFGLAYRILGSRAEAEDAVQDTGLKWSQAVADGSAQAVDNPPAWLTTLCTRHCIDLLRAAHRTRVDYVGTWLPEPIHTLDEDTPEQAVLLASSLGTAFLLVLERLTPRERAAYLLHEIFEHPYPEVAAALGLQEAACRKLVSRARAGIEAAQVRHVTPRPRQQQLLDAFRGAIGGGGTQALAALLSDDIRLSADSGGKVPTIRETLLGRDRVLGFIGDSLRGYWSHYQWVEADLNGGRGVLLQHQGATVASVSFGYDAEGGVTDIFIMRNPDKLAGLDGAAACAVRSSPASPEDPP